MFITLRWQSHKKAYALVISRAFQLKEILMIVKVIASSRSIDKIW